jgi:hypothetical protein
MCGNAGRHPSVPAGAIMTPEEIDFFKRHSQLVREMTALESVMKSDSRLVMVFYILGIVTGAGLVYMVRS